jgi:hypothetical protein
VSLIFVDVFSRFVVARSSRTFEWRGGKINGPWDRHSWGGPLDWRPAHRFFNVYCVRALDAHAL